MHNSLTRAKLLLASHSTIISTLTKSFFLSTPNFKIHPCRDSESVPPRPELPESFRVTNLTASSIMSKGIKIGV